MCLYAGQILNGHHPAPYRDEDARAYARAVLIPAELLEHPGPRHQLDLEASADWLRIPADDLRLAQAHPLPRPLPGVAGTPSRRPARADGPET